MRHAHRPPTTPPAKAPPAVGPRFGAALVAALLGAALVAGQGGCCGDSRAGLQVQVEAEAPAAPASLQPDQVAQAAPVDPVVATVAGDPILRSEVDREIDRALKLRRRVGKPPGQKWLEHRRRRVLFDLVERRLVRKALADRDQRIPEERVDDRLRAHIEETFLTRQAFLGYLEQADQTEAEFREQLLDELAVEALVEDPASLEATEEEVRAYYEKRKEHFKARARVNLAVIVLKQRPNMSPAEVEELEARARSLSAEARSGRDFAALAREHSDGPTAARGGALGWVHASHLDEQISARAFKMQVGTISDPIRTRLGFQIIKVVDRRPDGVKGFDEVEDSLRRQLKSRKRREARDQLLIQLKRSTPVQLHEERLDPDLQPTAAPR